MEVKVSEKYAKELLDGVKQACFKQTESGTQFTGTIKFRLFGDGYMKRIEISLWPKYAEEPMFVAKEIFLLNENNTFTFEPITLGIGFGSSDVFKDKDEVHQCSTCKFQSGGPQHWHCNNHSGERCFDVVSPTDGCSRWKK